MNAFIQNWFAAWNSHDVQKLVTFYHNNFGAEIISEDYSYHDLNSLRDMAQRFFNEEMTSGLGAFDRSRRVKMRRRGDQRRIGRSLQGR